MKAVVVGVAGILFAALAHAAPSSKVTPPPGWVEDTRGGALPDLKNEPDVVRSDVRQRNTPDGATAFKVVEVEMKSEATTARVVIDGFEMGLKRSIIASGRELSLTRRDEGEGIVVDQVVETEGARIHSQRHYAMDDNEHVHSATLTCVGATGSEDPACAAAFASFQWTFKPSHFSKTAAAAAAYTFGQMIVYFGIATVVVLLFVFPMLRKKKRASAK